MKKETPKFNPVPLCFQNQLSELFKISFDPQKSPSNTTIFLSYDNFS